MTSCQAGLRGRRQITAETQFSAPLILAVERKNGSGAVFVNGMRIVPHTHWDTYASAMAYAAGLGAMVDAHVELLPYRDQVAP